VVCVSDGGEFEPRANQSNCRIGKARYFSHLHRWRYNSYSHFGGADYERRSVIGASWEAGSFLNETRQHEYVSESGPAQIKCC